MHILKLPVFASREHKNYDLRKVEVKALVVGISRREGKKGKADPCPPMISLKSGRRMENLAIE